MFKNIKIENFRCFKSFELQELGRINLLVGENNSGKTSILEAIQLLCSPINLEPFSELMKNRGEYFWDNNDKENRKLDIKHLFYGHEIEPKKKLSISGMRRDNILETLNYSIEIHSILQSNAINDFLETLPNHGFNLDEKDIQKVETLKKEFFKQFEKSEFSKGLGFSAEWTMSNGFRKAKTIPILQNIYLDINLLRPTFSSEGINQEKKAQFVTSSSLTTQKMIELFDRVVLTDDEKLVLEALQTIEPNIEKIAYVNHNAIRNSFESRSGFVVRLSDSNQRVPIGSMGDGVWRMLGLALAIVCAKDGVLFVDEIDTGLHFTAMADMLKLIWETAKRLIVQVFATSHSSDCWTSLVSIASEEDAAEDGITIQRIEKDKDVAVLFDESDIVIAAEREIEVR